MPIFFFSRPERKGKKEGIEKKRRKNRERDSYYFTLSIFKKEKKTKEGGEGPGTPTFLSSIG